MGTRQRLRRVTLIVFAAVTLWIAWALVDDVHAAALAYDRSPMVPGTPSPNFTGGIDWGAMALQSAFAREMFDDRFGTAWENAAKREIAAGVALAVALVLLPKRTAPESQR